MAGGDVWLRGNCNSCHALFGLGGHLGPDLTNVIRLRGAPVVVATLRSGRVGMPEFAFSEEETRDLIAYLRMVDESGTYPAKKRPLPLFGDDS